MAKIKTAIATIEAFGLTCPECGEGIQCPNEGSWSSFLWSVHETNPATIVCESCGTTVKVPRKAQGRL